MSFKLQRDVDFAWVTANFGSGSESYKITHYSLSLILKLFKKYGHRKKFSDVWQHKETGEKVFVKPIENLDIYERLKKEYAKNQYDITDANALLMRKEAICTVLLDWKTGVIQDKNGKNVQCGQREKEQLNIDSPARSNWIFAQAMDLKTFIPDQEQEAKNSEGPSSTENEASVTKNNSRAVESVSK